MKRIKDMVKSKRENRGFTLAEVMMAVAIIAILAGVSFIGVNQYMKSMALLERNGIAKEIYVAAQNHLTMAKGQGYLGVTNFGTPDKTSDNALFTMGTTQGVISDAMLPFGSIDETVRSAGTFYVRYQKDTGQVLDVFYWTNNGDRFDISGLGENLSDLQSALGVKNSNSGQKSFKGGVIGWYGASAEGASSLGTVDVFDPPKVELINDDILYIKVTNDNSSGVVKLYVGGVDSGAAGYMELELNDGGSKYVVLDDVANPDRVFSKINTDAKHFGFTLKTQSTGAASATIDFIPGEDIRVYAEAYDTSKISTTIGRSATSTTNSLYQAVQTETNGVSGAAMTSKKVFIKNCRHLENLNNGYSMFNPEGGILSAVQTDDLYWNKLNDNRSYLQHLNALYSSIGNDYSHRSEVVIFGDNNSQPDCYVPVSPSYKLDYDGAGKKISDVQINYADNAGMIGTMSGGSVKDLQLVNIQVTASEHNAGALAGELTTRDTHAAEVLNVLAYNDNTYTQNSNVIADRGAAGGLIGSIQGTSVSEDFGGVNLCAAALYVRGSGNTGGLIGTVVGTLLLQNSYSGGHTDGNANYSETISGASGTLVNVIGGGNVGGLVGAADSEAGGTVIQNCYSTCSAYGTASGSYVGGLVGKANGRINNCYATGWVAGEGATGTSVTTNPSILNQGQIGAFAGSCQSPSNCKYYEIINYKPSATNGIQYLSAVGGSEVTSGITALDTDASTYNNFTGAQSWKDAVPYDSALTTYYGDNTSSKYNLKTVEQLDADAELPDGYTWDDVYVSVHYGDWPAPEIFVINQ